MRMGRCGGTTPYILVPNYNERQYVATLLAAFVMDTVVADSVVTDTVYCQCDGESC